MRSNSTSAALKYGKLFALIVLCIITASCSLESLVDVGDAEIGKSIEPSVLKSKNGAIGLYNSSVKKLGFGYSKSSYNVALMTDELLGIVAIPGSNSYDARTFTRDVNSNLVLVHNGYAELNSARNTAFQSRQLFKQYGDSTTTALLANAYAIEAMAIVQLAEHLCSGFPLTRVPFEGDVQYSPAVSTDSALRLAIILFDSALAIEHDSVSFLTLAKIGKGRALMNLKEFSAAAIAVDGIAKADSFFLSYSQTLAPSQTSPDHAFWTLTGISSRYRYSRMSNGEGINGLMWMAPTPAQQDKRIPVATTTTTTGGVTTTVFANPAHQLKYSDGNVKLGIATWIDAKMILAEEKLSRSEITWLDEINEARRSVSLPDTVDPGNSVARENLLFREKAFWGFLKASRLGDMRRLVRQYSRNPDSVYPVGSYTNIGSFTFYGDAYVMTPPTAEWDNNYKYTGCLDYNP